MRTDPYEGLKAWLHRYQELHVDADRREVLRLRYLDGLRWEDVTEKLYGDVADFWDKPEIFLRRTFKLHGKALEELSKFVPLEQGQEMTNEEEHGK